MLSVEHGHFLLVFAFALAVGQSFAGLYGARRQSAGLLALTPALALAQFLVVIASFGILVHAFVVSDFSVKLVADNSHSTKPLLYKISGTWGNHEGSMMMWVAILAAYGAAIALFSGHIPARLRARILAVQGAVGVAFYLFILLTSNPFWRIAPPVDGLGLNPLLQDPGLAFHPPFLYLGYVGLSVAFSFAIAGLLEGRVDAAWARFVRPWTLAAWVFLTIGIALGSWWAYYELGWGGYWFWDPVENASFMPWLIAVALLHSAAVVEKRETLKSWTILLAIIGFSFSLIGTFIVRSGVITSVHSFASDPTRGIFILAIILLTMIIGFGLYAWRAPRLQATSTFAPISRESGIVINNLLLMVATGVVLFGTLWPLFVEVFSGEQISVGAPFFDKSFTPFFLLLAAILPIGAMLPWKRGHLARMRGALVMLGALALGGGAALWLLQSGWRLTAPIAMILAIWVIGGGIYEIWTRTGGQIGRLRRLRGGDWGKFLAHSGVALVILAVGVLRAYEFEDLRALTPPVQYQAGGFNIDFQGVTRGAGPNYEFERGDFVLSRGENQWVLHPEIRLYPIEGAPTTEAAITPHRLGDLYIVMRRAREGEGWSVYFYLKPLSNLLWIGAGVMALGGFVSLGDRRLRLGVVDKRRHHNANPIEEAAE